MTADTLRRDPGNALVAIAALARSLPDPVLVGIETAGLAALLAVYIVLPERWVMALPFSPLVSFGIWGVSDRMIASHPGHRYRIHRRVLRVFQSLVATIGTVALVLGGYALIGWTMGVFIS